MEHKYTKFFILLLFHFIQQTIVYLIGQQIIYNYYPIKDFSLFYTLIIHCCYNLIYFFFLWKSLYSFNYHYLLKKSAKFMLLKNLLFATLCTLLLILLVYGFSSIFAPHNLLKGYGQEILALIIIDLIGFILLYLIQIAWTYSLVHQGYLQKNVLLIGAPDKRFPIAAFFEEVIKTNVFKGQLFLKKGEWYLDDKGVIKGPLVYKNLPDLLLQLKIGELIIFIGPELSAQDIYQFVDFCRENSIGYYLVPDIEKLQSRKFWNQTFPYIPLIERFATKRDSLTFMTVKRLLDFSLIFISLPFLLPVCLLVALLIKLEDRGPIFYVSQRVGKNGKIIKFYKFRSMVCNAEALKQNLLRYNERQDGPLFKIKKDPRVTHIGKIIRKLSLDEIPQLLNVLRGEMSIVGPRPHLISEVAAYTQKDVLRLECFPGITCYPQIHGRDTLPFKELVKLDLLYRKKWSLFLDIKMIINTFMIVIWPLFIKDYRLKKPY